MLEPSSTRESSHRPRYPGEDTTPTSDRELKGWYSYQLAAETFAVCGVGSFLPVTLEQLARENGVLWSDRQTPCFNPSASPRLTTRAIDGRDPNQCLVRYLGMDMTTASFAMYTFSAAVFVQALVMISFSSFADHGDTRKRLLVTFGYVGSFVGMCFLLVSPSIFYIAPVLVIVAVTCMGSSFVLSNSFLPLLAANHPSVVSDPNEDDQTRQVSKEGRPPSTVSKELQMSTRISSNGVGIGYAAAVLVQCLCILVLVIMNKLVSSTASRTLSLRVVLFVPSLWWAIFTVPAALWLRTRPGPPLESGKMYAKGVQRYLAYLTYAWTSVWRTIKVAVQLKQVAIFLVAWFLLSDAVATVTGTAILFARTELKMETISIALLSITVTCSGILGSVFWPKLSRRYGWKTNKTIVLCMALMEIIPLYGLLGFVPFVQRLGVGGLQQAWEIYPLGVIHGIVMGGISSYCRSFFGLLIPPGSEVAFYALFAITDKGSSAIGPTIVGRIVDTVGHIRPAFIFLAFLIALPIPLVWFVDADRGQEDAKDMARRLLRSSTGHGEEFELQSESDEDREESAGLIRGSQQP